MSLDISWLWKSLENVASAISKWFQDLWNSISQISNIGQGIFAGLSAFASALWNALNYIASQIYNAFSWIYTAFIELEKGLEGLGNWLWKGFQSIGQAIYSFGQWIWNGIVWIGTQIYNAFVDLWNMIVSTIESIWNSIVSGFEAFRDTINNWFTGLIERMRYKIRQSIAFTLATTLSYKYIESLHGETSIKNIFKKMISTPFIAFGGLVIGEILGSIIDSYLPRPSTTPYYIVPPLSIPQLSLPRLEKISPPSTQKPEYTIVTTGGIVTVTATIGSSISTIGYTNVEADIESPNISSVQPNTIEADISSSITTIGATTLSAPSIGKTGIETTISQSSS